MIMDARTLYIIYEARKRELELKLENSREKSEQSDKAMLCEMRTQQGMGKGSKKSRMLLPAA